MANIKSNVKRAVQNKKKHILRKGQRSDLKKTIKLIKDPERITNETISSIYSKSDRLARKNVISKNKAKRIKSKCMLMANKQAGLA